MKAPEILQRLVRDQRWQTPSAINLMTREGNVKDIANCHSLSQSLGPFCPEANGRRLPDMWQSLFSNGAIQLFLVENRNAHRGARILSFGITAFVTDEFCAEAKSILPPCLGVQLAQHYSPHRPAVLQRKEVACANAGTGVNAVTCFGDCDNSRLSRGESLAVREKQSEAWYLGIDGYQIKEFLAEPFGEEALQWMLDAGARVRRDYSDYFRKNRIPIPSPVRRPWLVGLTREEALEHPGSYLANLFVHTPPRFHFTTSEQILLQHALVGETCEDLAKSLFISPWTVKKRWQQIYDRVLAIDPDLVPPGVANGAETQARGAERRRRLLNYLRQHPEELRPFDNSRIETRAPFPSHLSGDDRVCE